MRAANKVHFVTKLFDILQTGEHFDVISWSEDGTQVVVKNRQRVLEEVLLVKFKLKNYDSFVRQLNIYDFKKVDQPSVYSSIYMNVNFKRN